jgi:hypothetical protein
MIEAIIVAAVVGAIALAIGVLWLVLLAGVMSR